MFNNNRGNRRTGSGGGGGFRSGGKMGDKDSRPARPPRDPNKPRGPRGPLRHSQRGVDVEVNYKHIGSLHKYLNDRGKIISRRFSGVSAKSQRKITEAIKKARFLALLPSGGVTK